MIAVSIVSHGHGSMVLRLIEQLRSFPEVKQIIVTRNIVEKTEMQPEGCVSVIDNLKPRGFGANHNAAFVHSRQPYFCVLNPDISFADNPFPSLLKALQAPRVALVAPLVQSPAGEVEDYARRFPGIRQIAGKLFGGDGGRYPVQSGDEDFSPDWVAGMFMLFPAAAYAELAGFDEGFRLYYEDVDLCVRAWRIGLRIVSRPGVSVVHDARRDSRRKLRYLFWHLSSMARYFIKHWGRLPMTTPATR